MIYLVGAVVVVGSASVLNLVLALGIIKRLRELGGAASSIAPPNDVLPAGQPVGAFAATTLNGRAIGHDTLRPGDVVGFFAPSCQPCQETVPAFAAYAAALSEQRVQVIAVVVGAPADAADFLAQLAPVANVIVAGRGDAIVTAFAARGFPSVYVMGEAGIVTASGHGMGVLPQQVFA